MSISELLLGERQALIQERLGKTGRVIAADLATELGVSEDTIRRDLREMASAGLCRRVYGGALPIAAPAVSYSERVTINVDRKEALARATAALVEANTTLFLDAGSTNLAIAHALPTGRNLTVATNAPAIAAALIDKAGIEIVLIGGQVDKRTGAAAGAKALRDAEAIRPDLCILGACGIDAEAGVTASTFEEAEFKRFIATRSRNVLTAITNDKLSTAAPYAVLPLSQLNVAVFEADADEDEIALCAAAGVRIHKAG